MNYVYWIRTKEQTDYNTEGYIGVTNNLSLRKIQHKRMDGSSKHLYNAIKKYGWNNLIVDVIWMDEDLEFILLIEQQLRLTPKIGWNIVEGGGKPPSWLGKTHSNKTKNKIGDAHRNKGFTFRCTNLLTSESFIAKIAELQQLGFNRAHVHKVASGQSRSHKNYTFERISL
jgi:group I intron endonuclease